LENIRQLNLDEKTWIRIAERSVQTAVVMPERAPGGRSIFDNRFFSRHLNTNDSRFGR